MFMSFFGLDISSFFHLILFISSPGSFPKPLTPEEEQKYLRLLKEKDEKARAVLIEKNLRLVAHIIKKYHSNCKDQEDLISIGTIGLIKAIDSFDCDKGTKLATYAARCIENAILTFWNQWSKSTPCFSKKQLMPESRHQLFFAIPGLNF